MRTGDRSMPRRVLRHTAWLAAGVLLLGACDGDNLFEGGVAEEAPSISMSAPTSVESGDQFAVTVTATAPRGISFIDVSVAGNPTGSDRFEYDGITQLESETINLTASSSVGSQITIDAFVQDATGRNSATRRVTIQVTSPTTPGQGSD